MEVWIKFHRYKNPTHRKQALSVSLSEILTNYDKIITKMTTFLQLMREKYEAPDEEDPEGECMVLVKHRPTIKQLRLASLEASQLKSAGPPGQIGNNCSEIRELDISYSKIQDFEEILKICRELPKLSYLSISGLFLDEHSIVPTGEKFENIEHLLISETFKYADQLTIVSNIFPAVEQLTSLSSAMIGLEGIFPANFTNVRHLNLSYNGLKWDQILYLKDQPHLTSLILVGNPITEIQFEQDFDGFHQLNLLNVEESNLKSWVDVYAINTLPVLKELRIGNTPLSFRYGEHFRMLVISYCP